MSNSQIQERVQWSADELDDALKALLQKSPVNPASHERIAQLLANGTEPARRSTATKWPRRALSAALVAAAVVLGLLIPTLLPSDGTLQNTAAAATLADAAAAAIKTADPAVPPGSFRYIHQSVKNLTQGGDRVFTMTESDVQTWIPADPHATWLQRSSGTLDVEMVGDRAAARAAGIPTPGRHYQEPDLTAPCGNFFGTSQCEGPGNWQQPTLEWIAALPSDPGKLYRKLHADSSGHGRSDEDSMLTYATDALKSGLLPATVRSTLYLTLARIPGLQISDITTTLDGRTGTAFSITSANIRNDTIIDPATGQYIGTREVALAAEPEFGLPANIVTNSSSVVAAVVTGPGATR